MAITAEIKQKTEETKQLIANSSLDDASKKKWTALLDASLENCNGRTQEQKIQGLVELLLDHTRILAERAVKEHDEESLKEIKSISDKVDELTNVQTNQQSMMKGLHDNMEKLFQLSDMLRQTNDRIGNLEARETKDSELTDNRINTVFARTADDIGQIRNELSSIREDAKKSQQVFLEKLDEYTEKLSGYDKAQDAKVNERFDQLSEENKEDRKALRESIEKLTEKTAGLEKQLEEPMSWKGVVARLFSKYTVLVIILVVLATLAFNPHAIDSITSIWGGGAQNVEEVSGK